MFGCFSRAMAWPSTRNRRRASGDKCGPVRIIFRATSRLSAAVAGAVDDPNGPATHLTQDLIACHFWQPGAFAQASRRLMSPVGAGARHPLFELLEERLRFAGCLRRDRLRQGGHEMSRGRPGSAQGQPVQRFLADVAVSDVGLDARFRSRSVNSSPRRRSRLPADGQSAISNLLFHGGALGLRGPEKINSL